MASFPKHSTQNVTLQQLHSEYHHVQFKQDFTTTFAGWQKQGKFKPLCCSNPLSNRSRRVKRTQAELSGNCLGLHQHMGRAFLLQVTNGHYCQCSHSSLRGWRRAITTAKISIIYLNRGSFNFLHLQEKLLWP